MVIISLKTLGGRTIYLGDERFFEVVDKKPIRRLPDLTFTPDLTFGELKHNAAEFLSLPEDDLTLFYGIDKLDDDEKVTSYIFSKDDFITIHQKESLTASYVTDRSIKTYPRATTGFVPSFENRGKVDYGGAAFERKKQEEEIVECIDSDPFDFPSRVMNLVEMGFEKEKVITAMRECKYDESEAIEYLTSGGKPKPAPKPKKYDLTGLEKVNFGEFSETLGTMTDKEKFYLLKLVKEFPGQSPYEIIQIYITLDLNYEATHDAL